MTKPPAPYKSTFFDRNGPDGGAKLRAFGYGIIVFGFTMGGAYVVILHLALQHNAPKSSPELIAGAFAAAALVGTAVVFLALSISDAAGSSYKALMVNGTTTPYQEQYSYQQSLVMQGRVDDALESFEAVIAQNPAAVDPRVRAAELYARDKRNAKRAAELFREIREIPSRSPGDDIYATHRLIDLLNGPLNDRGRALVELRRLIEKYPGTVAADHARNAIASLKPAHVKPHVQVADTKGGDG